jgi:GAF domain-containing protein
VAFVAFAAVGAVVGILVDELARLAREQAALRRVATLPARAAPSSELFSAVTEEAGHVLDAERAVLHWHGSNNTATVVGAWGRTGEPGNLNTPFRLEQQHVSTIVADAGRAVHLASVVDGNGRISSSAPQKCARTAVGAPIVVSGSLWGTLIVLARLGRHMPRNVETRLQRFTDLVAMAAETAESRTELAASRARVVAAADETRRRIERDLHDGAQQRLVSLGLELRTAESTVPAALPDIRTRLSTRRRL